MSEPSTIPDDNNTAADSASDLPTAVAVPAKPPSVLALSW